MEGERNLSACSLPSSQRPGLSRRKPRAHNSRLSSARVSRIQYWGHLALTSQESYLEAGLKAGQAGIKPGLQHLMLALWATAQLSTHNTGPITNFWKYQKWWRPGRGGMGCPVLAMNPATSLLVAIQTSTVHDSKLAKTDSTQLFPPQLHAGGLRKWLLNYVFISSSIRKRK